MPARKASSASRKPQSASRASRGSATRRKSAAAPVVHVLGEVAEGTQIELTVLVDIRPAAESSRSAASDGEEEQEDMASEPSEPGEEDPRPGS
jgi:hypothetical protein